jgi:hypothetical protein
MQVLDDMGRILNATYSAEAEGDWIALTTESRSGRAAGRPAATLTTTWRSPCCSNGWLGLTPR